MGPRVPGRKDCGSLGDREQPHSLSRLLLSRGHPAPSAPQAGDPSWNHGHPQGNNAWAPGAPCPCHTRQGSCTRHGDIARSHMPALPSPVLGWRSSTDGLCPSSCSLTPSTLLGWAGCACLASAAPGSCCSLPASLSSAAQAPPQPTGAGTPGAQPHQCQCPTALLMLPHTHLTPAHVHSSLWLSHHRELQTRLMGICGHPHLQLWPTAWLKVASHRENLFPPGE